MSKKRSPLPSLALFHFQVLGAEKDERSLVTKADKPKMSKQALIPGSATARREQKKSTDPLVPVRCERPKFGGEQETMPSVRL